MRIVAIPRSGVRPIWTALAVVAFVVLAAITAKAEEKVIRIGYQKYGTLILLKAKGSLEAKLKPLGYRVTWAEFPAGPPLL
jgi:sulfonate transport system substrate-binding protein